MSTIKVTNINNASASSGGIALDGSGHVQVDGLQMPSAGALSNRNLIINGAMNVAQRATQVTGVTTGGFKTCDRMYLYVNALGTWTVDQSTDAPSGFSSSFKLTSTAADASPAANDYLFINYKIEAQDLQHLKFGASAAESLTLSFWVKSNKTGSATFSTYQPDASDRLFSQSYTINSADTWEYKTIAIPGDTAGGFDNDNNAGLILDFWLNSGSNFSSGSLQTTWAAFAQTARNPSNLGVGGAVSDYFAITGVQLEVGEKATPFEHRSYGDELARCQRYYQRPRVIFYGHVSSVNDSATANSPMFAEMRADPTASLVTAHTTSNISTTYPPATVGVLKNGWVVRVIVDSTNVAWYSATWQLSAEL